MYVVIDGPTLSLLIYSQLKSKGKEVGFLLGQKMEKVQSGITDSQIHTAQVHSYVYVTSFIPWPHHKCLYSRTGQIDEGLRQEILENTDHDQHVVGWYSFRHQTSQIPSMKEVSIHRNLMQAASQQLLPDEFVFFLCTSSANKNLSTHSSDHVSMVYRNGRFVNIPLTVKNLGDTSRTDYVIENSSPVASRVVHANLGRSENKFITASGQVKQVSDIKNLVSSMSQGLGAIQIKVNNSEAVLSLLETEVCALRDRVAMLEKEELQRAFEKAERQKLKEEEERKQQERDQEMEEEAQMNKLLLDLGLTGAVEESSHQQKRTLVPNTLPAIVPLPKLEAGVNPLYVSTLHDFDETDSSVVGVGSQAECGSASSSCQPGNVEVQLSKMSDDNGVSKSKDRSEILVSHDEPKSSNTLPILNKPKDPFDFVVAEVKSELNVNPSKQAYNTRQKNVVPLITTKLPISSEVVSSREENNEKKGRTSNNKKLEVTKADASKANGHAFADGQVDEHDSPSSSDCLQASTDDVMTMSSSPVF